MDDKLPEEAIDNVLNSKQFGNGDNEKAKSLYKIFDNDCNSYTSAVFDEYKKLWKTQETEKHKGEKNFNVNKAWNEHLKEITKTQGKTVDFSKND